MKFLVGGGITSSSSFFSSLFSPSGFWLLLALVFTFDALFLLLTFEVFKLSAFFSPPATLDKLL